MRDDIAPDCASPAPSPHPNTSLAAPPEGIIQGRWGPNSLVVWGRYPSRLMHLPGSLMPPYSAHEACKETLPTAHLGTAFTLRYTRTMWHTVKCRDCFTRTGRPRRKFRPQGGWYAYAWYDD